MRRFAEKPLATAIVITTGALWGFYWLPVRGIAAAGLPGPWGTLAITASALAVLFPFAVARRHQLARANRVAIVCTALGGAAFALYSVGLVHGRVAIIILLYFLTPVWSTLIARYVLGWRTTRMRVLAIVAGLAGLALMLGADGGAPWPSGVGEWMALAAGVMWSVATTGIRLQSDLRPLPAAFIFALGASVMGLMLAPFLDPWPGGLRMAAFDRVLGLALVTGGVWWGLSIASLMWATLRLEPARVGLLLMTEVVVGALSAAILAGEHLSPVEITGGALVLCAGILEVWPTRRIVAHR